MKEPMQWRMNNRSIGYHGFFKLYKYLFQFELFGGGWSREVEREVLHRGHAIAVIPYDPVHDTTLLIEQFRPGVIESGANPWLLEFIAGMVETGESEADVVRREAKEETGLTLGDVNYITTYYPSPGGSSETIALYWAETDLSNAGGVYGLPSEGEDIKSVVIGFEEALELVKNGRINNSLGIILLLWFQSIRLKIRT